MAFTRPIWTRIAAALSALNVVGGFFAAGMAEPVHAAVHAVLGIGFAGAAWRLRQRAAAPVPEERIDSIEGELDTLRAELAETQERMDFVERLLAREPERDRLGPER